MTTMSKNTLTVLVILGVFLLGIIIFLTTSGTAQSPSSDLTATTTLDGTASTSATTGTSGAGKAKAPSAGTSGASPAVGLSKVLIKDATSVSLYSGVDPSGRLVYKPIPDVDVATFKALTELDVVEHPSVKNGSVVTSIGSGSVAYYKDKNRIYVLSVFETSASTQTAIQVVQDADVASFSVLKSSWYAKDAEHVYRLEAPLTTNAYAPGAYVWHPYDLKAITNCDVKTFTLVSGAGLTYDAHDNAHVYRKGVVVGTYPE
jgi:hypothetical protein